MKYLIYISSAANLMDENALAEILVTSVRNNKALSITGILIHHDGTFIQVLEGEEDAIDTLYKVIQGDLRHKNIIKLIEKPLETRNFPQWSMGYIMAEPVDFENLISEINATRLNFLESDNPHAAISILKNFYENNRIGGHQ